jgi:hypothetical protein
MMNDVRELPENEILPVTRKIVRAINDVNKDDGEYFFGANVDSNGHPSTFSLWSASGHGRRAIHDGMVFEFSHLGINTNATDKPLTCLWVSYCPPGCGRIRFDYSLSAFNLIHTDRSPLDGGSEWVLKTDYTLECLALFNNALIANKCLGFNSVSAFEDLSAYSGPKKLNIFSKIIRKLEGR